LIFKAEQIYFFSAPEKRDLLYITRKADAMNTLKSASIAALLAFSTTVAVETMKNGFVTFSEGDKGGRTLMYRSITNGVLGTPQKIVNKGSAGGDIWSNISFDGKYLAFGRRKGSCGAIGGQFGGGGDDDYHHFHCYEIYIADLTKPFPVTPIKVVDEGYWPSWGDDSKNATKTLYYGIYTKGEIWKATVSSTGTISDIKKHASVPNWPGDDAHMQTAPNGQLAAIRYGGNVKVVGLNGNTHNRDIGGGCHPSWCADSYWLYHANSWTGNINGGKASGSQGGAYHWGSSANMKWAITISTYYENQNTGCPVKYASMTKTTTSLHVGAFDSPLVTSKGNFPDIHENQAATSTLPRGAAQTNLNRNYSIECSSGGVSRIMVNMQKPYVVELFDVAGVIVARCSGNSPQAIVPRDHVRGGMYIAKIKSENRLNTEQIFVQ
jgi:hypothetical protein